MPPNQSSVSDKRKLDTRNCLASKKAKTDNPFDYSSEAFKRWRARRLVEPAADVFAATTIRAEAHKLKRLPLEIRRMIYVKLFRQMYDRGIEVLVDAYDPVQPPAFGRDLKGQHYLDPKYVGNQIAAEAAEALYENVCFEINLSNLATFLQPRQSLPGVKPAALIRSLFVHVDGTRPYTGWGKENKMINSSDWIDLSKDMPFPQDALDDHPNPFHPSKVPNSTDSSADAWKWRENRDRRRAERTGLNLLCRMPKLKMLEVEVSCAVDGRPELRPLIPTIRRLRANGVEATVSSEAWGSDDFDGWYRESWIDDLTEVFDLPSPEDLEYTARHALTEHVENRRLLRENWLYGYYSDKCNHCGCLRLEFNELYEELKERVASRQALQGAPTMAELGVVDEEYGSSPPPEADQWATAVEERMLQTTNPGDPTEGSL